MNIVSDSCQFGGGKKDLVVDVSLKTENYSDADGLYGLTFLPFGFGDEGGPGHPSICAIEQWNRPIGLLSC